jgi:hypothetical protein
MRLRRIEDRMTAAMETEISGELKALFKEWILNMNNAEAIYGSLLKNLFL